MQCFGKTSALDRIRRNEKHLKLQNGDDPQLDLAGGKHPDGERSSPPLSNEPEFPFDTVTFIINARRGGSSIDEITRFVGVGRATAFSVIRKETPPEEKLKILESL